MVLLVVGTVATSLTSPLPSPAQPSHRSWRSRSPLTAAVSPLLQVFSCYQPVLCVCPNWRGDCRDGIVIPATVSRNVACKAVMTSVHCSRRLTFWKLLSCLVTIQWVSSSLLLRCTTCPEFADLLLLCILCQGRKLEFVQVAPLQRLRSIKMTSSCLLPPDHTGAAAGDICGDHWQQNDMESDVTWIRQLHILK